MDIPLFQVDAFAFHLFRGNPAAVCLLEHWLDDPTLQSIAAENNLSETAFLVPAPKDSGADYAIRWFTPVTEVDLCGHATLASAHVLFTQVDPKRRAVCFSSRSGKLEVAREGDRLTMSFPRRDAVPAPPSPALAAALGRQPLELWQARDPMAVLGSEEEVRALRPNLEALAKLEDSGFIVTAPGIACDFVSRYFAPREGLPEDPVTGSAHCTLAPYWSKRLGKTSLHARQLSTRGGELHCRLEGDKVLLSGKAVTYLVGTIRL